MLPQSIRDLARQTLGADITTVTPVSGGDINQAARTELADGRTIFVKWHTHPPVGMFSAEALGLRLLAKAGGLRVPHVHFFNEMCLGMEWLGPVKRGGKVEAVAWAQGWRNNIVTPPIPSAWKSTTTVASRRKSTPPPATGPHFLANVAWGIR